MRTIKRVRRGSMMGMRIQWQASWQASWQHGEHHGKHHGSSQANRSANKKASSANMASIMEAPTTLWGRFLEDLGRPEETAVPYHCMRGKMLPALRSLGYICPNHYHDALKSILCFGVDPLPRDGRIRGGGPEMMQCTFEHFLNILWHPLIEHLECDGTGPDKQRKESLDLHHRALVTEMEGIVTSPNETMDMDAWVEYMQQEIMRLLEVHVPSRLILQVVAPIVPLSFPATRATALHLLRSSLCSKLVGPAMATQANRKILAEISEVPVKMCAEQELNLNIRRDLIALLAERQCVGEADAQEDSDGRPLKKLRKDLASRQEMLKTWTKQVQWMLENRVAASRTGGALCSANKLLESLSSECCTTSDVGDLLASGPTLGRHLLILDGAVDRCTSEHLLKLREEGTLAGVANGTEDVPSASP